MSVIPSLAAGLAQLQALANFIDQGSANATFVFYDDTKPINTTINVNDSAKLVVIELQKPSLLTVNADSISLKPSNAGMVVKAGTAIWTRLFNGNGDAVADFTIGTAEADIILANVNLAIGSNVSISSITLRPA